ncbi:hypothetical protein AB0K16_44375 [Nonomuraea jabiensis]|uniref:hypothetical protein n=1 Tax=Nonomuraea jabiensis TaxID=882448 RepID=UPI00341B3422
MQIKPTESDISAKSRASVKVSGGASTADLAIDQDDQTRSRTAASSTPGCAPRDESTGGLLATPYQGPERSAEVAKRDQGARHGPSSRSMI